MSFPRICAGVLLSMWAGTAAALQILPAAIQANQEFVVQFDGVGCGPMSQVRAEVSGSNVTIAYMPADGCFDVQPPPATFVSAVLALPAGTYSLAQHAQLASGQILTSAPLGSVTIGAAATPTPPPYSLNGLWFVPSEPGSGVSITQGDSGLLFVMWFTYLSTATASSAPAGWFVASTVRWTGPSQASGVFYSAVGPRLGNAYDSALQRLTPVGVLTITAQSEDSITFSAQGTLAGFIPVSVSRTLRRFRF